MKQKISIILPVCNAGTEIATLVRDCLELVTESGRDAELIIVDDASDDATGDVIETLEQEYPQVSMISHGEKQGVAKSILHGLQRATGHLFMIYYITSDFPYPQIPVFCEGMSVTDAVVGRFVSGSSNFVGMAMFKQNVLDLLGPSVAEPDKMSSDLKSTQSRHIELRYEYEGKKTAPQKPHFYGAFKKTRNRNVTLR